jgi:hypothetical protein
VRQEDSVAQQKCATIHCTVSNCEYWTDHNLCTADSILITAPGSPIQQTEPHGEKAEVLKPTPAHNDEDTLCYTFEPRQSRM